MELTSIATELTCAATNIILAIVSIGAVFRIRPMRKRDRYKVDLWSWVLGLTGGAAILGALVHGLVLSQVVRAALWVPLFIAIGLIVVLFVVAAVYDAFGRVASRRVLPLVFSVCIVFYVTVFASGGHFGFFVLYYIAAMVAPLILYIRIARTHRFTGAGLISLAIAFNIVGAGVQTDKDILINFIWPFDNNSVFHLVQITAVVVLTAGLRKSLNNIEEPSV